MDGIMTKKYILDSSLPVRVKHALYFAGFSTEGLVVSGIISGKISLKKSSEGGGGYAYGIGKKSIVEILKWIKEHPEYSKQLERCNAEKELEEIKINEAIKFLRSKGYAVKRS